MVNLVMRQHTFIRFTCCLVWRGMSTCRQASPHMKTQILTSDVDSWWSKHVGVILSVLNVLMCDIWINVLLHTSAFVGPLHIVNWNARGNSEISVACLPNFKWMYWSYKLHCAVMHSRTSHTHLIHISDSYGPILLRLHSYVLANT
jgi:hypothetical protein